MVRRLVIVVVAWLAIAPIAWAGAPVVAVLDLDNATGADHLDGAGTGIASLVVAKLVRSDAVKVVERQRLTEVMAEIDLGKGGALEPATAAQAGKLLGADYIVVGTLFSLKLPELAVSVRVVDVESGQVLASEELAVDIGARGEELFVLVDELTASLFDHLEVRLAGRARIEVAQVDARELGTVDAWGRAIEAMDAGDSESARAYLGEALALEPTFSMAEATLTALGADVEAHRDAYAADELAEARELWDTVAKRVAGEASGPEEGVAYLGIAARLALIDGDLVRYEALQQKTADAYVAWRIEFDSSRWMRIPGPDVGLQERVQAIVTEAGGKDAPGARVFEGIVFRPHLVQREVAEVRLRTGRRGAAAEAIVAGYQHPGPRKQRAGEYPARPIDPQEWYVGVGMWDEAVAAAQQRREQARRLGHAEAEKAMVRTMAPWIDNAQRARQLDRELQEAQKGRRASVDDVTRESALVVSLAEHTPVAAAGYARFLAGVEAGRYRKVQSTDEFAALASAWRDLADRTWPEPWAAPIRLTHLTAYHDQIDAPADARRVAVRRLVEEELTP